MKITVTQSYEEYLVQADLETVDRDATIKIKAKGKTRWEAFDNLIKASDNARVWLDKIPAKLNEF